jgi:hypothetical protein
VLNGVKIRARLSRVSPPLNPAPACYAPQRREVMPVAQRFPLRDAPRLTVATLPGEERNALKFGCRPASGRSQRKV